MNTRRAILAHFISLALLVPAATTAQEPGRVESTDPRYKRMLASIQPTKILVYWRQDEDTLDEDRWSATAKEILEEAGHTVEVALDHDAFLRAAENGDFEVVLVWPIEEARVVRDEAASLLPGAALLPTSHNASRRELRAAKEEFGNVMKTPSTRSQFLMEIEESRASRAGGSSGARGRSES